jgi:carboxyl-terminal processing protease
MTEVTETMGGPLRSQAARRRLVMALLSAVVLVPGCSSAAGGVATSAPASAPIERDLALATFDSAWSRINNTFYDPTFGALDWPGVRDELRPRAEAARSQQELRAVINEMTGRIGESHFGVIPQEAADALSPEGLRSGAEGPPSDAGFEMRLVEGALVVTRLREGGPAEAAGVRTGWTVTAIDDREAARWLASVERVEGEAARATATMYAVFGASSRLQGESGSAVRVRFVDGTGQAVEREIRRAPIPGEPVRFGNLPTMLADVEHQRIPAGAGCLGVIRFNVWMTPILDPFTSAMESLAGCQGVVIDLRGNPGGVAGMIMGTSGFFLPDTRPLGIMRTRGTEMRLVSFPRRTTRAGERTEPFAGPVAILVDGMSASTSELFAAGLQHHGRARVFGETSAGQALPAALVRLPNQDVLMHVLADYVLPDGTRIEGRGVVPDQPVPLTRADLLAGRDAPMEAALSWIRNARGGN